MKPMIVAAALVAGTGLALAQGSPTAGGGTIVVPPSAPSTSTGPSASPVVPGTVSKPKDDDKPKAPPAASATPNTMPSDQGGTITIKRN